jgi:disulfide bond formation protein DsbB
LTNNTATAPRQGRLRRGVQRTLRERDLLVTVLAFALGLGTILGAWGSQVIGGLYPCELCLEQRLAYYFGLPILAVVLLFWDRLPLWAWYVGMGAAALVFAWGISMGSYHAGVEWGFWPGPTACTGTGLDADFSQIANGTLTGIVPCDKVQFRFLGISLAGYNALISLAIVGMLVVAMLDQTMWRKGKQAA